MPKKQTWIDKKLNQQSRKLKKAAKKLAKRAVTATGRAIVNGTKATGKAAYNTPDAILSSKAMQLVDRADRAAESAIKAPFRAVGSITVKAHDRSVNGKTAKVGKHTRTLATILFLLLVTFGTAQAQGMTDTEYEAARAAQDAAYQLANAEYDAWLGEEPAQADERVAYETDFAWRHSRDHLFNTNPDEYKAWQAQIEEEQAPTILARMEQPAPQPMANVEAPAAQSNEFLEEPTGIVSSVQGWIGWLVSFCGTIVLVAVVAGIAAAIVLVVKRVGENPSVQTGVASMSSMFQAPEPAEHSEGEG